jgi:hypothetical protein
LSKSLSKIACSRSGQFREVDRPVDRHGLVGGSATTRRSTYPPEAPKRARLVHAGRYHPPLIAFAFLFGGWSDDLDPPSRRSASTVAGDLIVVRAGDRISRDLP